MKRTFTLPESFSQAIAAELQKLGYRFEEPKRLADAALKLSDHYLQNPTAETPWNEPWAQAASLAYFFPLNYARNAAVASEAARLGFFEGLTGLVDYGSGTGSALFAFLNLWPRLGGYAGPSATAIDTSPIALELAFRLGAARVMANWERETVHGSSPPRALLHRSLGNSLLSASYVLTELSELPEWWLKFEALAFVEPSTQGDGRSLMRTRERLLEHGFQVWAPCCHQGNCPLLAHSERDWCHDRIHWEAPAWFAELERHLPIKNRTLTFSYLLARRSLSPPQALAGLARLTGDMLEEKGRTRQLICRGTEREFLAWFPGRLPKGERIELHRGSLLRLNGPLVEKANEARIPSKSSITEIKPDETPN